MESEAFPSIQGSARNESQLNTLPVIKYPQVYPSLGLESKFENSKIYRKGKANLFSDLQPQMTIAENIMPNFKKPEIHIEQ